MERLAIICTTCFKFVDLSYFDALEHSLSGGGDRLVYGSAHGDRCLTKVIRVSLHRLPRY